MFFFSGGVGGRGERGDCSVTYNESFTDLKIICISMAHQLNVSARNFNELKFSCILKKKKKKQKKNLKIKLIAIFFYQFFNTLYYRSEFMIYIIRKCVYMQEI